MNLTAIPQPIGAQLTKLAPSIAFSVSRVIDENYRWDGDGPDPCKRGFDAYDIDVHACTIVRGQVKEATSSLGGSYFQPDEPTGDIHGYLPQMLQDAARDLQKRVDNGSREWLELYEVDQYLSGWF